MRSASAQALLHDIAESFTSYKKLLDLWKKGQLLDKPKPPKYRKKGGMAVVTSSARWVKLVSAPLNTGVDGMIKLSLGKQVKAWFGIDHFLLPMPSNLDFKLIKEFRIVPRNNCFYLECIYQQENVNPVQI